MNIATNFWPSSIPPFLPPTFHYSFPLLPFLLLFDARSGRFLNASSLSTLHFLAFSMFISSTFLSSSLSSFPSFSSFLILAIYSTGIGVLNQNNGGTSPSDSAPSSSPSLSPNDSLRTAVSTKIVAIGNSSDANFPVDGEGRVYHLGLKRGERTSPYFSMFSCPFISSPSPIIPPPLFSSPRSPCPLPSPHLSSP